MAGHCCGGEPLNISGERKRRKRTWLDAAGCLVPGFLLALVPKCPMCVAAYLSLATGLALSASTAAWVRSGFIVAMVATVAICTVRLGRRIYLRNSEKSDLAERAVSSV